MDAPGNARHWTNDRGSPLIPPVPPDLRPPVPLDSLDWVDSEADFPRLSNEEVLP